MASWKQYLEFVPTTARLDHLNEFDQKIYLMAGLLSEVGECWGVYKRVLRDNIKMGEHENANILAELGDVMWYTAMLSRLYPKHGEPVVLRRDDIFYLMEQLQLYSSEAFMEFSDLNTSGLTREEATNMRLNIGDGLFMVREIAGRIAAIWGKTLPDVLDMNMAKLQDRASRSVIQGKGDNR